LTTVFGTTDRISSAVTNVGDKIFDIPVLGDVFKGVAPEFFALHEGLKIAEVGATGMAGLTDLNNYKDQSGKEVVKNILERSTNTLGQVNEKGNFVTKIREKFIKVHPFMNRYD
jgi:hypothetical protein